MWDMLEGRCTPTLKLHSPALETIQLHVDAALARPAVCKALRSELCSTQMVEQQFQRLFAGDVLRVHMAYDTRSIDGLVHEYLRIRHKLLDALDTSRSHTVRRDAARKAVTLPLTMSRDLTSTSCGI